MSTVDTTVGVSTVTTTSNDALVTVTTTHVAPVVSAVVSNSAVVSESPVVHRSPFVVSSSGILLSRATPYVVRSNQGVGSVLPPVVDEPYGVKLAIQNLQTSVRRLAARAKDISIGHERLADSIKRLTDQHRNETERIYRRLNHERDYFDKELARLTMDMKRDRAKSASSHVTNDASNFIDGMCP